MTNLFLQQGGKLSQKTEFPNITEEEKVWGYTDVSTRAHEFLFAELTLQEGVTLADLFNLMTADPLLLSIFRQDYANEL
jgi:hypothetical protein